MGLDKLAPAVRDNVRNIDVRFTRCSHGHVENLPPDVRALATALCSVGVDEPVLGTENTVGKGVKRSPNGLVANLSPDVVTLTTALGLEEVVKHVDGTINTIDDGI